jgi:hypothetical protein
MNYLKPMSHRERKEYERITRIPDIRLSVIIPTAGRSTLENAVFSVLSQLDPVDEVIVVGDRRPDISDPAIRYIHHTNGGLIPGTQQSVNAPAGGSHDAGGLTAGMAEREIGQATARGTHILHCDDDDIWNAGMINVVRQHLRQPNRDPREWHLYRMQYGCPQQWTPKPLAGNENGVTTLPKLGGHDWKKQQYGCQWIVMPNREWLPRWRVFPETPDWGQPTDWTYIHRYVKATGVEPVYHNDIVGTIRPTWAQLRQNLPKDSIPSHLQYAPQPHGNDYKGWDGKP